jgi:hypothetical protein
LRKSSGQKLDKLHRQTEANKNAIVFVCNWTPFWEAGILPAELLPLGYSLQVLQNQLNHGNSKFPESGNPDSTSGIKHLFVSQKFATTGWASD